MSSLFACAAKQVLMRLFPSDVEPTASLHDFPLLIVLSPVFKCEMLSFELTLWAPVAVLSECVVKKNIFLHM